MKKIVQTAGRNALNEFAPQFAHFNDDVLFGENWNNQDTPSQISDTLHLKRPIYRQSAVFGHFGRKEFPWEKTDKAEQLRDTVL